MDTRVISIIAAVGKNRVIGKEGKLPWRIKSDMQRFKALTIGHTVIMGRKTAEGLRRTLPGRSNIVISRNNDLSIPGFITANSLEKAFELAKNDNEIFVIGGAEIFTLALPFAQKIYLTEVASEAAKGDTLFPNFDLSAWDTIHSEDIKCGVTKGSTEDDFDSTFKILVKKSFLVMENARNEEQKQSMQRIESRGECPFCGDNLQKEHKNPILKEGRFWLLTENEWKYEEARLHFLLIYKIHAEKFSDLDSFAGIEMLETIKWLEKEFQIKSGAIGIRFGDMRLNGGTVCHLHVHVIVPYSPEYPLFQVVRFRMSAKK